MLRKQPPSDFDDNDILFLYSNLHKLVMTLKDCTGKYGKKTPVFCVEPSEAESLRKICTLAGVENYTISIKSNVSQINNSYENKKNTTNPGTGKPAGKAKS